MTQTLPNPITPAMLALANANAGKPRYTSGAGADWSGGATGDDVTTATAYQAIASAASAAVATPYSPQNQTQKAAAMTPPGSLAVDVTKFRGWIGPQDPYPGPGVTLASITPATAVHNTAAIPVACVGTGFTFNSVVKVDGVSVPTVYNSPTSLTATITPKVTAGTQSVTVVDHGVTSPVARTFTAS